jgi:hypothetical protein
MNDSICQKSITMLQGITELLCDIAVLSKALSSQEGLELSHEEKETLRHSSVLAQTAADSIESRTLALIGGTAVDGCFDPLLIAETQALEDLVSEVILAGHLISHVSKRAVLDNADFETLGFDPLYVSIKLWRKIEKLQKILNGLDCQQKVVDDCCSSRGGCLLFAWKTQRPEVLNYA